MGSGTRKRRISRESKMVARIIANKPKKYNTTYGGVYLNPIKRNLKNKPYINEEFNALMEKEVNTTIEMLKGENKK